MMTPETPPSAGGEQTGPGTRLDLKELVNQVNFNLFLHLRSQGHQGGALCSPAQVPKRVLAGAGLIQLTQPAGTPQKTQIYWPFGGISPSILPPDGNESYIIFITPTQHTRGWGKSRQIQVTAAPEPQRRCYPSPETKPQHTTSKSHLVATKELTQQQPPPDRPLCS